MEFDVLSSFQKQMNSESNETRERVRNDVEKLKKLIGEEHHLQCPQNEEFLLKFLRARKFNVDRAFSLLKRYYAVRAANPQLFANLYPSSESKTLTMGGQAALDERDENGSRIYVFRLDKFDMSRTSVEDIFRTNLMALESLSAELETQVNGIVVIVDLKGFAVRRHYKLLSPQIAKRSIDLIQDSFPLHFRAIHIINEPVYFHAIFSTLKAFMKKKLTKRIHLHGTSMASLHQQINKKFLPKEYGGEQEYDSISWRNRLYNEETRFREMERYGYVK